MTGPQSQSGTSLAPGTVLAARCAERIAIIIAAIAMMGFGGWLFVHGVEATSVSVTFLGFVLNGQGPGLAFMIASTWLLYHCLRTPLSVTIESQSGPDGMQSSVVRVLGKPEPGSIETR